jgi:hypothetical protein
MAWPARQECCAGHGHRLRTRRIALHPVITEICHTHLPIRPDVFQRWQRLLRQDVQAQLDELAALKAVRATSGAPPADVESSR